MAISDEIKEQTVKLKDMTSKEKADYIWTYYKWWILGAVAIIFICVSLVKTIAQNSKPVYLDAMFLNSKDSGYMVECPIQDEFVKECGVDLNKYNIYFDLVTTLTDDYGNQASYAGQVKLISKYSAEELDVVCAEESILSGPGDVGGYAKLMEVLPEDLIKELQDKGYEFYYYTEKIYDEDYVPDKDEETPYTEGETYAAGIYIENCKKLVGNQESCVYNENPDDRHVLAIAWNAPNLDHAIEFIRFVTK